VVDWYDDLIMCFIPLEYLGHAFNTYYYTDLQQYCLCTEFALILTCSNDCILRRREELFLKLGNSRHRRKSERRQFPAREEGECNSRLRCGGVKYNDINTSVRTRDGGFSELV
jgi:hypothetical protein